MTSSEQQKQKTPRKRKKQLYKTVRTQMEFYFSDSNLARDGFLSELINQDSEGYVDLSAFLKFNKLKPLVDTPEKIASSLRTSEFLQLSDDKTRVKRKTPIKIKDDVDDCTIYMENLPSYADHDWIKDILKGFGTIDYISLPKLRSGKIKGFAFIEFDTPQAAKDVCRYFGLPEMDETPEFLAKEDKSIADDESSEKIVEKKDPNVKIAPKRKAENDEESKIPVKKCKIGDSVEINEADGHNKKHRKRKKKPKERNEVDTLFLRVISKKEWKRLRNKYLTLQKANMAEVKRCLGLLKPRAPAIEQRIEPEINRNIATSKAPQFIPGAIIKLNVAELFSDPKQIRNEIKGIPGVAYVELREGQTSAYIRCQTQEMTADVLKAVESRGVATVLQGEEEEKYWQQISEDRNSKLNEKVRPKRRGTDKLMQKTVFIEQSNNHIRFD